MSTPNWKGTAEFVGVVAIVGSLIFVGWQIKQEQDIALAEINLALLSSEIEINIAIGENAEVWAKGNAGEELTRAEQILYENLLESVSYHARTDRRQYLQFDQKRMAQVRIAEFAYFLHRNPGARETWQLRSDREEKDWSSLVPGFNSTYRAAVMADLDKLDQMTK